MCIDKCYVFWQQKVWGGTKDSMSPPVPPSLNSVHNSNFQDYANQYHSQQNNTLGKQTPSLLQ